MSIQPLPQFEADLSEYLREREDRDAYERLNVPTAIVVRFGVMRMVGEFPYKGDAKPGCGSKIVVRTHRGHELGEMLTSTCPNAGCASSVSRKQMLEYIESSGGRDYPFYSKGQALRIATGEDLDRQAQIEQSMHGLRAIARDVLNRMSIDAKVVNVEPILGGERTSVYLTSEQRIELPELTRELGRALDQRVEVRTIGARDEARINADYERCGQYCCCKSFLKVLKPVSMKSAKMQKATLDPLKISGRCGRLMCCLRYEDQTYDDLRKNLPHRKARVGTPEGDGYVMDTQILTQLALVRLDSGEQAAIPVENLTEPESQTPPPPSAPAAPRSRPPGPRAPRSERSDRSGRTRPETPASGSGSGSGERRAKTKDASPSAEGETKSPGKRRRRRRRSATGSDQNAPAGGRPPRQGEPRPQGESRGGEKSGESGSGSGGQSKKKRRRRRRRPPGAGPGEGPGRGGSPPNRPDPGSGAGSS